MSSLIIRRAHIDLVSKFAYCQSRYYEWDVPHLARETHAQYEERTHRSRLHTISEKDDRVFVPVDAIKQCVCSAASRIGMKVPGHSPQNFTGRFKSDILVEGDTPDGEGVILYWSNGTPIRKNDERIEDLMLMVSAQGKKGGRSGSRVPRIFPVIRGWKMSPSFQITDPAITNDIFLEHLSLGGLSIGIGTFRLEMGGRFGRFLIGQRKEWSEINPMDFAA